MFFFCSNTITDQFKNKMAKTWIETYQLPKKLQFTEEDFQFLMSEKPKEKHKIKIFGKEVNIPRFQQAYGRSYKYSGTIAEAKPIPKIFEKLIAYLNKQYNRKFNMILINWYMNGEDYISMHSDNEKEIVNNSPIVSISLGDTRTFILQNNETREKKKYELKNNNVIVMGGTCQKTHKHGINKEKNKGVRINLTVREVEQLAKT